MRSATGQDWGLPAYRWDVFADRDFDWLRHRARRNADLCDGYRVDHLVGFYRTYYRDGHGQAGFTPPDEPSQLALGERVLVFRDAGAEIIAEDLGTVPDFVRASLARLEVPGYKVFRWERQWDDPGQPFRDPASYPSVGRDVGHARHRADDDLVGECVARREEGRAGDPRYASVSPDDPLGPRRMPRSPSRPA